MQFKKKLLIRFINESVIQIDKERWFINDGTKEKLTNFLEAHSDISHGVTKLDRGNITKYLVNVFEEHAPEKARKFNEFLEKFEEGKLKRLAIEKLYVLYRKHGAEFINDMYSLKLPTAGGSLTVPHTLLPLNDVVTHGRSKSADEEEKVATVGRGEVTIMFMLENDTMVDPGSAYDLTIDKRYWHVKDNSFGGGINAIDIAPMGKSGAWDKTEWPFDMFKRVGITGARRNELSAKDIADHAFDIAKEYDKKYRSGRENMPNEEILDKFQEDLDSLLRNSKSWGEADGVAVIDNEKIYFVKNKDVHFSPQGTTQGALRFTINLRRDAGIYGALSRALDTNWPPQKFKPGEQDPVSFAPDIELNELYIKDLLTDSFK